MTRFCQDAKNESSVRAMRIADGPSVDPMRALFPDGQCCGKPTIGVLDSVVDPSKMGIMTISIDLVGNGEYS